MRTATHALLSMHRLVPDTDASMAPLDADDADGVADPSSSVATHEHADVAQDDGEELAAAAQQQHQHSHLIAGGEEEDE